MGQALTDVINKMDMNVPKIVTESHKEDDSKPFLIVASVWRLHERPRLLTHPILKITELPGNKAAIGGRAEVNLVNYSQQTMHVRLLC